MFLGRSSSTKRRSFDLFRSSFSSSSSFLSSVKEWEFGSNRLPPSHSTLSGWVKNYLSLTESLVRQKYCEENLFNSSLSQQSLKEKSNLVSLALSSSEDGIKFGMTLRSDVLALIQNNKQNEYLLSVDSLLSNWLFAVFCNSALQLQRITFDTSSGLLLEKIASAEAVHKIRALSEMKNRLTNGRRCFALFHPCLPNDPLAFVHIALAPTLVTSMKEIFASVELDRPLAVMYYSINSPHSSLTGMNIAASLLKKTALHLQRSFPSLRTHSTLSPIPGFMKWLKSLPKDAPFSVGFPEKEMKQLLNAIQIYREQYSDHESHSFTSSMPSSTSNPPSLGSLLPVIVEILSSSNWYTQNSLTEALREPVCWLGYYYLICAKGKPYYEGDTKCIPPLDLVARFHLRNGALLHQINWLANSSLSGLSTSAGMMVNYKYDLDCQEENILRFQFTGGSFPTSQIVPDEFRSVSTKEKQPV